MWAISCYHAKWNAENQPHGMSDSVSTTGLSEHQSSGMDHSSSTENYDVLWTICWMHVCTYNWLCQTQYSHEMSYEKHGDTAPYAFTNCLRTQFETLGLSNRQKKLIWWKATARTCLSTTKFCLQWLTKEKHKGYGLQSVKTGKVIRGHVVLEQFNWIL